MADPITIIGAAGAIGNIIDVLGKIIGTVSDLRDRWNIADLTVLAFESQLSLLKDALCQIQEWADANSNQNHYQLVMRLERCVTCCRLLVSKIDKDMAQFETTAAGELDVASKVRLLFKTKDMDQAQRMIEQQIGALTLLLTACNSNALEEQKRLLKQQQAIRIFKKMDEDTASMIVHRDTDSTVTATSVSSSKWSMEFAFDNQLFITKLYERWIRKLAAPKKMCVQNQIEGLSQQDSARQQESEHARTDMTAQEGQDPNALTRQSSTKSQQSSRSSLREILPKLRLDGISFEINPLKRNSDDTSRTTSQPSLLSQAIDRRLDEDARRIRREASILVLGSCTRKRVIEEFQGQRLAELDPYLYRSAIFKTLVECAKALVVAMRYHHITPPSNAARKRAEFISSYEFDSNPDAQLSSEFAETIDAILETLSVAALLTRVDELDLPDHAAYFFDQMPRILSTDYYPTAADIFRASTMPTGVLETRVNFGQLTVRLIDMGDQRAQRKKWIHGFEGITSILFVVDLDSYDQVLQEEGFKNTLMQSLLLFDSLVNSRWFTRTSIILLLAKLHEFKQKLPRSPLGNCFPDYTGGNDFNSAAKYILGRFNQVNRAHLEIYSHVTDASDTSNIHHISAAIKETIINHHLRDLLTFNL